MVGSKASSNANRLREVAERLGAQAYLIDDERGLERTWFSSDARVGVSAGASTPEHLITAVAFEIGRMGVSRSRNRTRRRRIDFFPPTAWSGRESSLLRGLGQQVALPICSSSRFRLPCHLADFAVRFVTVRMPHFGSVHGDTGDA